MTTRADVARDVCRIVAEEVRKMAPAGLGHWPEAWTIVEAPSGRFLDVLADTLLKPFGVGLSRWRTNGDRATGYLSRDLTDPFTRYLGVSSRDSGTELLRVRKMADFVAGHDTGRPVAKSGNSVTASKTVPLSREEIVNPGSEGISARDGTATALAVWEDDGGAPAAGPDPSTDPADPDSDRSGSPGGGGGGTPPTHPTDPGTEAAMDRDGTPPTPPADPTHPSASEAPPAQEPPMDADAMRAALAGHWDGARVLPAGGRHHDRR